MAYRAPQKVGAAGKQTGGSSTTRVPKAAKPKVTKARSTTTKPKGIIASPNYDTPEQMPKPKGIIASPNYDTPQPRLILPHEMIAGKLTGK